MSYLRRFASIFIAVLFEFAFFSGIASATSVRTLSVADASFIRGVNNQAVSIFLFSEGNEVGCQFSLTFDPSILSNPRVALGANAAGATLLLNLSKASQGKLGITLSLPISDPPTVFIGGPNEIVKVTFDATSNLGPATTTIDFGTDPTPREVSDNTAHSLATTYTAGTITLNSSNNPVPTSISLTPTSATAGGSAFRLTVQGTNFIETSEVRWNKSARTTHFVSGTELTADIAAVDIASSGTASVTVANPPPGGGTSNALTFTINNPVPAISGLSPASILAGSDGFTLTVSGTNFVPASKVQWNGEARSTTFVSSTRLTAPILAKDISVAVTASVTVFSPAPGGGTSNVQSVTVENPVPHITGLIPATRTAGCMGFTLAVNGAEFVNTSVVQWNGTARPTTVVSAMKVTASILAADIASVGTANVAVVNPGPGGGTSNTATVMIEEQACTYTITPTSGEFTASGGSANFTISTQPTCPWSAATRAGWISFIGAASGTGNGTVSYSVSANSDSVSRTGTITVADQSLSITQGADNATELPDLMVSYVRTVNEAVVSGHILVNARVTNIGQAAAAPFLLGYYFSADSTITTSDAESGWSCNFSAGLAAGATAECNGSITVPTSVTSGTYYVGVIADKAGVVTELNEDNNARVADSGTVVVRDAGDTETDMSLGDGGADSSTTVGSSGTIQAGYATVDEGFSKTGARSNSAMGNQIYGTAIIVLRQNGVAVSETPVPASPPSKETRIFVDYRAAVTTKQDEVETTTPSFNTGLAMVNMGSATATIAFTLRDSGGTTIATGTGLLAARAHFAKFVDQLSDVVPDFHFPSDFGSAVRFGTLDISSDQPLSVLALRMAANQRGENLYTSTPSADMTQSPVRGSEYFPRLVDGGGWKTMLILMNTTHMVERGSFRVLDGSGQPLTVRPVNGDAASTFDYTIPADGVFVFETDGSPANWNAGSVQLTPAPLTSGPMGVGVFGFTQGGVLVTESGIPAATPTTHTRIYVDTSWGHNTGLAIANPSDAALNITLASYKTDGITPAGMQSGPLTLPANGMVGTFVDSMLTGLPDEFTGVLDISSPTPFVALALRTLYNERGDFLISTFPIADFDHPAPSPIVFPQIADGNAGGNYQTQFILLSTQGGISTRIHYFGDGSGAIPVGMGSNNNKK